MIFCVEDDEGIRNMMVYTLRASGFAAEGYADGQAMRAAMETALPELILLDIMLPGEDGISILKELRSHNRTASVPVIMATFVSAFFKADTIRKYGLPIKDFFIWADDLEYTRRISRRETCYAVTKCRALHDMHSNAKVGIENDAPDRLSRYSYLYRNEVYVYRREGFSGFVYLFLRAALHTFKALTCGKQPFKRAKIILKSFISGWSFKPQIEFIEQG